MVGDVDKIRGAVWFRNGADDYRYGRASLLPTLQAVGDDLAVEQYQQGWRAARLELAIIVERARRTSASLASVGW